MIKAHATKLVSRRIYLLFVAATSIFLGCSTIVHKNLVLARHRTIFRLPTIVRSSAKESNVSRMSIGGLSSLLEPRKQEETSKRMGAGISTNGQQSSGSIGTTHQNLLSSPPIVPHSLEEMMYASPSDLSLGTRRKNHTQQQWIT
jgi:hypothetical protein